MIVLLKSIYLLTEEIFNAYRVLINKRDRELNNGHVFIFDTLFVDLLEQSLKKGDKKFTNIEKWLDGKKFDARKFKFLVFPFREKQ